MLNYMRKNATSWFIKLILAIIVVVFVLWGVGSFNDRKASLVATVNGAPITVDEYRETYNGMLEQYRRQMGGSIPEDLIKAMNLEKRAMDQLIDRHLMLQRAVDMEIRVSDQELTDMISGFAAFQTNGVFDPKRYRWILSQNRLTPETFEAMQRQTILAEKLRDLVVATVEVSDPEAREWFNWRESTVNVDFIKVDSASFTDVSPKPDELNKWFESRKENYKTQPEIKASYLAFKYADYEKQAQVSDKEVRDWFDQHPSEFELAKSVEARHILFSLPKDANDEQVEEKRKKASEIMELARKGEDFAELAKTHSDGPSAKEGGYLGEFKEGEMVKPFSDKAFSMKEGEISDPVRTDFGWHIIKLEKIHPARKMPFEEAMAGIMEKLKKEKGKNLATEKADLVYQNVFEPEDMEKEARAHELTLHSTDFFTRSGPEKLGGVRTEFAKTAFELKEGLVSELTTLNDGLYIIQVLEKKPEIIPEFEVVKDRVEKDWIASRQDELAKEKAEELLGRVKKGESLMDVAQSEGLTVEQTGFFTRERPPRDKGFSPAAAQEAFSLTGAKPLPSEPAKGQEGYLVFNFLERKLPTDDAFNAQKDRIVSTLLQQKQMRSFRQWLDHVRENSEVFVEEAFRS